VNPKILVGVGAGLGLLGAFLASISSYWALFLVFYAFTAGLGFGLAYVPPLVSALEWIPNSEGVVTGIIISGFGFGAFVFSFVCTAIANPNNLKPEEVSPGVFMFTTEVTDNIPRMLRTLGLCWAGLGLLAVILVRKNPSAVKEEKSEEDTDLSRQLTFKQGVVHPTFILIVVMDFLSLTPMFYMSQVAKTMPIELTSFDDHFLTLVVSMGSVCNGLFRIMWGILQDRFSFKTVFVATIAI